MVVFPSCRTFEMTGENVADVALDWCAYGDISYEEKQKHESGEDVVVLAVVSPHQLRSSSDEEDISYEEVDVRTRISHGVLAAISIVYDRNKTTWKNVLSSLVGKEPRDTAVLLIPPVFLRESLKM